jgi:hypothetical protein
VQAVEDYLNYTKISYFSPLELEDRQLEKRGKRGRAAVLHIFPNSRFRGGCGKKY